MEGSTGIRGDESLENLVIEVQATVDKVLDARLKTLDVRLARIEEFVTMCETLAAQLQESPMFSMLVGQAEGGSFGFPLS